MKGPINNSLLSLVLGVGFIFLPDLCKASEKSTANFSVDFARFRAKDNYTYLELYYSIPRDYLSFKAEEEGLVSEYKINIGIYISENLLARKSISGINLAKSFDEIKKGQQVMELYPVYLQPGEYLIKSSLVAGDRDSLEQELIIPIGLFSDKGLSLSDIQLATQIAKDKAQNRFVKNQLQVVPNPERLYGTTRPNLVYYAELYNLSSLNPENDSSYSVKIRIQDPPGTVLFEQNKSRIVRKAASLVERGEIDIRSLATGSYDLLIEVTDQGNGKTVERKKSFLVYSLKESLDSETAAAQTENLKADEFEIMNEQELDEHFTMMRYILKRKDANLYKDLDIEGKRNLIRDIWKKRDDNLLTARNEFKDKYLLRYTLANQQFGQTSSKEGWRTDRGRILMLYGGPDDIRRFPMEFRKRPHEIWIYYELEGGIEFIFIDETGYGDYRLIHSTARNEIHNRQWEDRLSN